MQKIVLSCLLVLGLVACSDKGAKSVEYYKIHGYEAQDVIKACNSVEVKSEASKADCINAEQGFHEAAEEHTSTTSP